MAIVEFCTRAGVDLGSCSKDAANGDGGNRTAEGFEIGSQLLNLKLTRTPKHDVGPWFLKHEVMLNEVFLGVVPQDGKTPAKVPRVFRWVPGEYLDLQFDDFAADAHGVERRRLQPDAVLEDTAGRRRYFIEYETGSATVRDAKKSTSTPAPELLRVLAEYARRGEEALSRYGLTAAD